MSYHTFLEVSMLNRKWLILPRSHNRNMTSKRLKVHISHFAGISLTCYNFIFPMSFCLHLSHQEYWKDFPNLGQKVFFFLMDHIREPHFSHSWESSFVRKLFCYFLGIWTRAPTTIKPSVSWLLSIHWLLKVHSSTLFWKWSYRDCLSFLLLLKKF